MPNDCLCYVRNLEIIYCPLHEAAPELRRLLLDMAIPYEALLMDRESRKWIAPSVWQAIESSVVAARAALNPDLQKETQCR